LTEAAARWLLVLHTARGRGRRGDPPWYHGCAAVGPASSAGCAPVRRLTWLVLALQLAAFGAMVFVLQSCAYL
jgi:hypothetical protein